MLSSKISEKLPSARHCTSKLQESPAQKRRDGQDPVVARAILDDFSDLLQSAALQVHGARSKNSSEIALGASSELDESEPSYRQRGKQRRGREGVFDSI